jgi:hypothetical protein
MRTTFRLVSQWIALALLLCVAPAWAKANPPKDDNKLGYTTFCSAMGPRCNFADRTFVSKFVGVGSYRACGCYVNTDSKHFQESFDRMCKDMGLRHQNMPAGYDRLPERYNNRLSPTGGKPVFKYKKYYSECFVE